MERVIVANTTGLGMPGPVPPRFSDLKRDSFQVLTHCEKLKEQWGGRIIERGNYHFLCFRTKLMKPFPATL